MAIDLGKKPISEILKERLHASHKRFFANDNISEVFNDENERAALIDEVTDKFTSVLKSLVIDVDNDPNSQDTGRRLAKMYVNELMAGRFHAPPKVTAFPNEKVNPTGPNADDMRPAYSYSGILIVPVELISLCSHHWQNVIATCYIGIIPGPKVIGLSKYARIAQHVAARGTLQEQLTSDIMKEIQKASSTLDVAVYVEARHGCMECRGVRAHDSTTQTVELGGVFIANPALREEFYANLALRKK